MPDPVAPVAPAAPEVPAATPAAPAGDSGIGAHFVPLNVDGFLAAAGGDDFPDLPPDPSQDSQGTEIVPADGGTAPGQEGIVELAPIAPAQVPGQQPAVATPAVAPQQPQQPAPGQAPVQPAAPTAPQAQQPAPAPAQEAYVDPFKAASDLLDQQRDKFVDVIAQNLYQIDETQMQAVLGGDPKPLSKLCAQIQVNTVNSIMRSITQHLPVHVHALMESDRRNREREDSFWAANPSLDRKKHSAYVVPTFMMFKQMNPSVTDPDVINRMVGALVATAAGIQVQPQAAAPANARSPQVRTPGRVVRQTQPGYSAAGVSNGGAPAAAPNGVQSDNMWDRFTAIVEAQQRGELDGVS